MHNVLGLTPPQGKGYPDFATRELVHKLDRGLPEW